MEKIFDFIIWEVVLLIVLSSLWVKNYFEIIIPQMHLKYKILIWSSIISVAYYFISKSFGEEPQFYNFF